jgi:hypothetical protein
LSFKDGFFWKFYDFSLLVLMALIFLFAKSLKAVWGAKAWLYGV